jgi:hypothetical protein
MLWTRIKSRASDARLNARKGRFLQCVIQADVGLWKFDVTERQRLLNCAASLSTLRILVSVSEHWRLILVSSGK